jgi:hypothetical protein
MFVADDGRTCDDLESESPGRSCLSMHPTSKLDERSPMNGFSVIIPRVSAFVPMMGDILVAVLLSWIALILYKTSQNAAMHKADAVLLELDFDLLTVAVLVLWLGIFLEIFF